MHEASRVYGGHRAAEAVADDGGLLCAHRPLVLHHLLERPAVQELGPDADLAGHLAGAVDHHHVGVLHSGEELPFAQHGRAERRQRVLGKPEPLERNFVPERRVPGTVDLAECAAAHPLTQDQRAPGLAFLRVFSAVGREGHGCRRQGGDILLPVYVDQLLDDLQLPGSFTSYSGVVAVPVNRRAVEDGFRDAKDAAQILVARPRVRRGRRIMAHAASPAPDGRARA